MKKIESKRIYMILAVIGVVVIFSACSHHPANIRESVGLPEIYPDYIGVTVPVDIAPLDFAMADDEVATIDVSIKGSHGGSIHVNGDYADFDVDQWHNLLRQNKGGRLFVTVMAEKEGQWIKYRDFTINVSSDNLGEWGVTYRLISPGYEMYGKMSLCQRDLSCFDETELLANTRTPGQCLNCHTANRTNPDQYVFHIRGKHGATAVSIDGMTELLKAKNDLLGGSMVYPYWHPQGRYCAFSTDKTSQMFHMTKKNKRIEVYDSESDVFVYDTQTHTLLCDSLTMKKDWAECTPAFSPDGRWLYYTTAHRQTYPKNYDKEKYSLCRVRFDAATGRIGQKADTLINALHTGCSATWPRPSYDDRYIMYTQVDYGYFSIWHPEADLWLLDTRTGHTRRISEVDSNRAESFHNWSTNSCWFLFTSRRDDGLYTRLYFSHIDSEGHATKPFLLPQRNPKHFYRRLMYSYNTPDFASRPIHNDIRALARRIMSSVRVSTKAM